VIEPVNGSTVSMINATTSIRGLLTANIAMAAASRSNTIASSVFMECFEL
jgi:hypothetical protein